MQSLNLLVYGIFSISGLHADVRVTTLHFKNIISIFAELAGLKVEVGCNGNVEDEEANEAGEFVFAGKIVSLLANDVAVLLHGGAAFLGNQAALHGVVLDFLEKGHGRLGNVDGNEDALEQSLEEVDHETLLEVSIDLITVVVVVTVHPRPKQVDDVARYGDVDESQNGGESGGICQAAEDEIDAAAVS